MRHGKASARLLLLAGQRVEQEMPGIRASSTSQGAISETNTRLMETCDGAKVSARKEHPFSLRLVMDDTERAADCEVDLQLPTSSESYEDGQLVEAVEALAFRVRQGSAVDISVFYGALKRCIAQKNLFLGRRVHALATVWGHGSNTFLANHFICMYGSHGRLEDAMEVFNKVSVPNRHMWASLIFAHVRHGQATLALQLYRRMRESKLKPNNHVYVAALKACAFGQDLFSGREVHADILGSADKPDMYVGMNLVRMYLKCGSLGDARRVFDNLSARNVVTWNAMISGYFENGLGQEALNLYGIMQQEGITPPNRKTFVSLLQACASLQELRQGKQVHAQIQERDLESDVVIGNCLIHMYRKCRSIKDARRVFDNLPKKDVVTWTSILAAYNDNGLSQEALSLYARMQQYKIPANQATFICLLCACASTRGLIKGKEIHALIQERGWEADLFVANSLVNMYAKCGSLDDARRVFDNLPSRDVVTWNSMMAGYAQHGHGQEALALYGIMQEEGITAGNAVTFICLLQACASTKALHQGEQLHAQIQERGLEADLVVGTCLVDMYAKCGRLDVAQRVFDDLPTKDVVTWNAIIAGHAQHGLGQEALSLYECMQREGKISADVVTYILLLQACATLEALQEGKHLHSQICNGGFEADILVGNALVNMYAKCGSLEDAHLVFDNLDSRDVVTWNSIIKGYAQQGLGQEALTLYTRMKQEGVVASDVVTFICLLQACANDGALQKGRQLHTQIQERGLDVDVTVGNCLINLYARCGSLDEARRVFDNLQSKDVVTWNVMMGGYTQQGLGQEALAVYDCMQQEGVTPANAVTLVYALQACSRTVGLQKGKEIHAQISKLGLEASDMFVANALVDMYGKCGSMTHAQEVFDTLPTRDTVTWNALIAGYSHLGDSELFFELILKMRQEGIQPNGITFTSILTLCSHVGLVEKGQTYFQAMSTDYCITPTIEHYSCMVDLFGRAGYVDKAMEMVMIMPFQPSGEVWRCLLGACQKWNNVRIGRQAFEFAVRLEETDASAYILMSNIYAAADMWEEAEAIDAMRVKAKGWKTQGQSRCADIGGAVHLFSAGDREQRQHLW